jgi:predicted dinucleotide-binding enzyme
MALFSAIAVLGGSGHQGRGLAQRLTIAGERVIVGSRDPERARTAMAAWPAHARAAEAATNRDAVARADLAILAVPFPGVAALLAEIADQFKPDALVIDVTVPWRSPRKNGHDRRRRGSAAQRPRPPAAACVSPGRSRRFRRIFSTISSGPDAMSSCAETRDRARASVGAGRALPGLRAIDVGVLSRAESVEHLTALAIAINRRHKIRDARFRVVGLPS